MDTSEWRIDIFDSSPYKNEFCIQDFHGKIGIFSLVSHMNDDESIGELIDEETASDMGILYYNVCQQTIDVVSENQDDFGSILHTFKINEFRLAVYDLDRNILYDDIDSEIFYLGTFLKTIYADEYITEHTLKNYVIIRQIHDTVQDGKCVYVENVVRHNEDWS